jgi:predicted solute-binding protein
LLQEIYSESPELFPKSISDADQIADKYFIFRSYRRGSDTRALNERVKIEDIQTVNRWKQHEKAGAKRPNLQMHQHYADLQMLLGPFLRYTAAM